MYVYSKQNERAGYMEYYTQKFLKQEKSTVAQATAVNRVAADTNSNSDEREQECEHRGWKNMVDSGMLQRQKQS